jgi:hypothetical protein
MEDETETAQQQTLRQLINAKGEARKAVRLAESECEERHNTNENDSFRAKVNGEIRAFLKELQAIRQNFNEDVLEADYWQKVLIGSCNLPDGSTHKFVGLDDLLSTQQPVQIEVEKSSPGYGGGKETVTQSYYLPTRIYVEGYYMGVRWMADVGLMPTSSTPSPPDANPVDPAGNL